MREPEQIQRAMLRLAEQRIAEAMEAGVFDGLAGAGQPLPGPDEAYDELWWVKRWLTRERCPGLPQHPKEQEFSRLAAAETLRIAREPRP